MCATAPVSPWMCGACAAPLHCLRQACAAWVPRWTAAGYVAEATHAGMCNLLTSPRLPQLPAIASVGYSQAECAKVFEVVTVLCVMALCATQHHCVHRAECDGSG